MNGNGCTCHGASLGREGKLNYKHMNKENQIQLFKSDKFGAIRVMTDKNGEPWLVGKDVAVVLGYKNPNDAIGKHIDDEDKGVAKCDTLGGTQSFTIINESGFYSLAMASKLPQAKQFKRWVTAEVLPQIRRTGGYIPTHNEQGETLSDLEIMARALEISQRTISQKDQIIAAQQPAVTFTHAVEASVDSIGISELAKLISQNGVETGQKRLFQWLRDNGYLGHQGEFRNMPMQRFVEQGLFEVQEYTYSDKSGNFHTTRTTKVTGKGQTYFINLFINNFTNDLQ